MVTSMRGLASRCVRHCLTFAAAVMAAIPAAYAAPQENPFGDAGRCRVCSTLGECIFVGGTGGFDTLSRGDLFDDGCALPGIKAVGIVSA
jgi:hypothetical protein